MGLIRRELHAQEINSLADDLRALAHPARLAILQRISLSDSCICTDLSKELGLAQATVSGHLKALKEANLIRGTVEGNSVCYCINKEKMNTLGKNIAEMFAGFSKDKQENSC